MSGNACRIAVVGSINRDTICTPDGTRTESYGGILYSIAALDQIGSAEIFPVCNVGKDVEDAVRRLLGSWTSVRLDGVRFVPERNPHCFLTYDSGNRKRETLLGGVPALAIERLRPFLDCDAVCFNFITGMELELRTLRAFRRESRCLVLMDVHSLTLGIDSRRCRFFRMPPGWEAWLACANIVQLNEHEAGLLAGAPLRSVAATGEFGERVLGPETRALLITRGEEGADSVVRNPKGGIEVQHYPARPADVPVDETGCGDAFLMGFTWSFLKTGSVPAACRFANRIAGAACCLRGIEQMARIGDYLK
ncbi:MAG: carbohydrate kinase family protein [Gemmatimonadota bacterium]|nr:carbohydrate kinase family protein [Gemmatimonadota bacterium]